MVGKYKKNLNPIINFIAKPLKGIDPNILTLLGLLPPLIFFTLMAYEFYTWALISMAGILLDTLDGAVARMSNKVSRFGGVLDSTFDRVSDSIFIAGFAVAQVISYELAFFVIMLSFLISYIRARSEVEKADVKNGIIERPERLIIISMSLLAYILFPTTLFYDMNLAVWGFVLLGLLSFITVLQRLVKSYKELK